MESVQAADFRGGQSFGEPRDHFLNEWFILSRSKVLVACGEIFAARDED